MQNLAPMIKHQADVIPKDQQLGDSIRELLKLVNFRTKKFGQTAKL